VIDKTMRQLVFCSTKISIGNGRNTLFWEAHGLIGMAPKELAPNMYQMARRKEMSVCTEQHNLNWIQNLKDIISLLKEFTLLFMALSDVQFSDQQDIIRWKWTADGQYIVTSAYECQFEGSIVQFPAMSIWQTMAESKCKFFAWLVMHDRVLSSNNMLKMIWPCNYICAFCFCLHETTEHLLMECNFTEAV
jgi:hypothetical protein